MTNQPTGELGVLFRSGDRRWLTPTGQKVSGSQQQYESACLAYGRALETV
ncbi:hypothetical protein [Gordonia sp. (in: high G+C Gram-positive bacteria)]